MAHLFKMIYLQQKNMVCVSGGEVSEPILLTLGLCGLGEAEN